MGRSRRLLIGRDLVRKSKQHRGITGPASGDLDGPDFQRIWALLHKSDDKRTSPIPGRTHPTASVTGMPSAVKPFSTAARTWNSATWRSKSRTMRR